MEVVLYNFSKKVNSLKLPTSGTGRTVDVNLKQPTTLTAPTITLSNTYIGYNYVYIPSFNRYYFVNNTNVVTNTLVEFSLAVDVLSTYRNEILKSWLYVKRSASDGDEMQPDEVLAHSNEVNIRFKNARFPYNQTGCYIVTIVNGEATVTANPASTMYVMDEDTLYQLLGQMYDRANLSDFSDPDLVATFYNPIQYITSCRWFPFAKSDVAGPSTTIKYGWKNSGISANLVTNYGHSMYQTINLETQFPTWRDFDPNWTQLSLYVPGFGSTPIDPIYNNRTLYIEINTDFNTGNAVAMITLGSVGTIIGMLNGKLGCDVALSQLQTNPKIPTSIGSALDLGGKTLLQAGASGGFKSIINMGKGLLSGQNPIEVVMDTGKSLAPSISESLRNQALNPSATIKGSDGDRFTMLYTDQAILTIREFTPSDYPTLEVGLPVNKVMKLENLSGYTVVANGLIEMEGLLPERNAICSILEGGFYIE